MLGRFLLLFLFACSSCLPCCQLAADDLRAPPETTTGWRPEHPAARWGHPAQGVLLPELGYLSGYSGFWRGSLWIQYRITRESLAERAERSDRFFEDKRPPAEFRPTLADYRGARSPTGVPYHRGHGMSSRLALSSEDANLASFNLINVYPQLATFNTGGAWRLNEDLQHSIFADHPELNVAWVALGPAILPGADGMAHVHFIGESRIPVATHFWVSILAQTADGTFRVASILLPHSEDTVRNLNRYSVSVDDVERAAGLDLWSGLPDDIETELEILQAVFE